jgi:uncharacterized membrane protein YhaH (DUF805 family)
MLSSAPSRSTRRSLVVPVAASIGGGRCLLSSPTSYLGLLTYVVGIATSRDGGRTPGLLAVPLIILFAVFALGIIVPTLALTVRRLHDAGYSGLLALLFLVPYVGGLIIMIFALMPSSPAGAKYDPVPATPAAYYPYPPQTPYPQ